MGLNYSTLNINIYQSFFFKKKKKKKKKKKNNF